MYRCAAFIAAFASLILLEGCQGRSIDYLAARAKYLLFNPSNQPAGLVLTDTPVPAKVATMLYETAAPTATMKQAEAVVENSPSTTGKVTVNGGDKSVVTREGPGHLQPSIGTFFDGQVVEVTGRSPNGDWWRVKANGLVGWVFTAFLTIDKPFAVPCIEIKNGDCAFKDVPAMNEQALTAIRSLVDLPNLSLIFREEAKNPNADLRMALIYMDEQGGEYWVDKETTQVVFWMPKLAESTEDAKTVDELRMVAKTFAEQHSAIFIQNFNQLNRTESTKDGSAYAFRWDNRSLAGYDRYPFLLVVVRTDGRILSYMNSLDVLVK